MTINILDDIRKERANTLYREPDCQHSISTIQTGETYCTVCGAQSRWVAVVEPDYEAANSYLDNIKSLMTYAEMLGLLDAAYGLGEIEEEICPDCDGLGWTEGMDSGPRDPTGMTPMQVQIQCECGTREVVHDAPF